MNELSDARPLADNFAEFAADPDHFRSIVDVPAEIAARIPGFADFGIEGQLVVDAVRKAGPQMGPATPTWTATLTAYGENSRSKAEFAEAASDGAAAQRLFLEASFWYFLARFPHVLHPAGAEAYKLHTSTYLRAAQFFENPIEVFEAPFETGVLKGYLRLPTGTQPSRGWPLVMLWGGIDVWKSDLEIHSQANALLRRGMATLAVDMPGTGESPILVAPDADRAFLATLTAVRADDRIDAERVGCYGLSFGGHWAAKMALIEPSLAGVVNVGGPVHHAFQPAWLAALPQGAKLALAKVLGLDLRTHPEALAPALARLDLVGQGLLPTSRAAPLLSLNGERDALVPIADLDVLSEYGVRQDRLKFAEDRHVASRNWRLHEEFAAGWLARKLEQALLPRRGRSQVKQS